jgi:hypothetical protein
LCISYTRYTGKERDTESGLDYFGARYMSSSMGRFMSPESNSSPTAAELISGLIPQKTTLKFPARTSGSH